MTLIPFRITKYNRCFICQLQKTNITALVSRTSAFTCQMAMISYYCMFWIIQFFKCMEIFFVFCYVYSKNFSNFVCSSHLLPLFFREFGNHIFILKNLHKVTKSVIIAIYHFAGTAASTKLFIHISAWLIIIISIRYLSLFERLFSCTN